MKPMLLLPKEVKRETELIEQLFVTLRSSFNLIIEKGGIDKNSEQFQNIIELFEEEKSRKIGNHIEQLLASLYDDVTLTLELERKLVEARILGENIAVYYNTKKNTKNIEEKRALLIQLIKDLQWFKEAGRIKRFYEHKIRRQTSLVFLAAFVFFFTPTLSRILLGVDFSSNLRIYYLFTASSAGLVGAAFSVLTGLKKNLENSTMDNIKIMQRISYTITRVITGAGAGLIMFYFLQSGLLEGVVFPEFYKSTQQVLNAQKEITALQDSGFTPQFATSQQGEGVPKIGMLIHPTSGLSLLIIWSFLAGFSEKLIPNLLSKTEKQMDQKNTSPPQLEEEKNP